MSGITTPNVEDLVINSEKIFSENPEDIGPYHVLTFGKYKNSTILQVFSVDLQYLEWIETQKSTKLHIIKAQESIKTIRFLQFDYYMNIYNTSEIVYNENYTLSFGKYKGITLQKIRTDYPQYYEWLKKTVPTIPNMYETWVKIKIQIKLLEGQNQLGLIHSGSSGMTPSAPNLNDLQNSDNEKTPLKLTDSVAETADYYYHGKSLEEIAAIRKVKIQTIEDHISKCIECGLIERKYFLDEETFNYIKDIIDEKCNGIIDKIKPIKIECDDGEIDISYSQIKYTIADIRYSTNH